MSTPGKTPKPDSRATKDQRAEVKPEDPRDEPMDDDKAAKALREISKVSAKLPPMG